jgi:hypothetical protein
MNMTQLILFDYETLSDEDSTFIRGQTGLIKSLVKRSAKDIIDIGTALIGVKHRLAHGQFTAWLSAEFDWSERTARKLMMVSERFKTADCADIAPSALYLLASPSTPSTARAEAIHRANEHGENITHTEAKAIVGF